ncbi:MAG: glycosyltransferase family 2 protein [Smithella sp.]
MFKELPLESFPSQTIDIVIPAYNARNIIQQSVTSTLLQEIPTSWQKNIIIVDDGSSDGTGQHCQALFKKQVNVIYHKQNRGISAGRNTGWRAGYGRYVVFMDADCEWRSTDSLAAHLATLESGADVCTGAIFSREKNFWGTYQNALQSSREKDFSSGNQTAFTCANFAIRRSLLEKSSGFDEGYRHYGFEDRDLLLRLISLGSKIYFSSEAAIIHQPYSSLDNVCRKFIESGQNSSVRFQTAHPDYYARSLYGKVDCRIHGFPLTVFAVISEPLMPRLVVLGDKIVNSSKVPFPIKKVCVKIMSGLSYMVGTYRGMKS